MSDSKDKPDGTTFTTHVAGGTVGTIVNVGQVENLIVSSSQQAVSNSAHGIRVAVGDFVGREKEIGELKAALRAGGKAAICGLKGMGGVGKTELAIYVANELKADFPDAQLLLDMRGTQDAPRSPRV